MVQRRFFSFFISLFSLTLFTLNTYAKLKIENENSYFIQVKENANINKMTALQNARHLFKNWYFVKSADKASLQDTSIIHVQRNSFQKRQFAQEDLLELKKEKNTSFSEKLPFNDAPDDS